MEKQNLTSYRAYLKRQGLKDGTAKNYLWHVRKFLLWNKNQVPTSTLLKKYQAEILNKQKNIGSINLHFIILNNYLIFSKIKFNFTLLSNPKNRLDAMTPLQLQTFLDEPLKKKNLRGYRDKALLEILYTSGLKVNEITKLQTKQVDFLAQEIIIDAKRHLTIPPYALHYLEKYLNFRRDKNPFLFINFDRSQKGGAKALSVRSIERIIEYYALTLRPRLKVSPQTLRNTLAYNLKSQGAEETAIKEALNFQSKIAAANYLQRL